MAVGGDGSCLQATMVEVVASSVRLRQREEGQRSAQLLPRRVATVWSERPLLVICAVDGSERSLLVASVLHESIVGCDGNERSLPTALCNERLLLVMIKLLLVTIKVDGNDRSLLATIKDDGSERSLLVVLCSERSLLVVIKVDGGICAARDVCCG
ncbi:hypothetical protein BHE74_00004181 [Ensete ventricosum]|nr:hypothetical protein GW17_00006380 [Ensete ventricosum]RWW87016.1 hypothetical protein BHE74_00004181 [Ensete ventricosum]RZS23125.1 hypothetical protein BHM03_00055989 [Ensete ventricosum]